MTEVGKAKAHFNGSDPRFVMTTFDLQWPNGNSTLNRVEIRDSYGVRTASTPDAFALYDKTFVEDIAEFAGAVLDDKPLSCSPNDAFEAGKIACALQHSFRVGTPVYFDDNGAPIMTR